MRIKKLAILGNFLPLIKHLNLKNLIFKFKNLNIIIYQPKDAVKHV